jgi:hypothetical protein
MIHRIDDRTVAADHEPDAALAGEAGVLVFGRIVVVDAEQILVLVAPARVGEPFGDGVAAPYDASPRWMNQAEQQTAYCTCRMATTR